jgi:hypothetical protein
METPAQALEGLFERIEAYGKTSFELSKLKSLETSTVIATCVISRVSVVIVFACFILFASIGIALFLGGLLGRPFYGFLIVAGFYLIASIILHFCLYKWIKKPFSDFIITQVLQ